MHVITTKITIFFSSTQKPVDFVVPSAPATNAPPSPVEPAAIASNSLESAGALCSKLSMLEAGEW